MCVPTAKAKEMRQRGIQGEFQISLPRNLLIAEMDLCALLGNALDNAMEAAGEKYRQDGPGSLSGGKRPVYAPGGQCTGWG